MPDAVTINVRNLRGLSKACKLVSKEASRELRTTLRQAVEPVRSEAEINAVTSIRRVGMKWSRMRTGVTQRVVYVAPRQKGARNRFRARRPNLADLLLDRAMIPALHHQIPVVEHRIELMLTELGKDWERVPNG